LIGFYEDKLYNIAASAFIMNYEYRKIRELLGVSDGNAHEPSRLRSLGRGQAYNVMKKKQEQA
jgi:hypothetical protein